MIRVIIAVLVVAMVGCGRPKKAETPMQALENMRAALAAQDGKGFAECFVAADAEKKKFAATACEYLHLSLAFEKKMTAAYGTNAVEGNYARSRNLFLQLAKGKSLEGVGIKTEGDKAVATVTNLSPKLDLVKEGGIWKIRMEPMAPPFADNTTEAIEMTTALMGFTRTAMDKIGKPGQTAAKIQEEIRMGMLQRIMPPVDPQTQGAAATRTSTKR